MFVKPRTNSARRMWWCHILHEVRFFVRFPQSNKKNMKLTDILTLSLLKSYMYGDPIKARNLTSYIYIYGREFLLGILLLEPCISLIYAWKTNRCTNYSFSLLITHHVTRHNTYIHNILSTAPQFSISQKELGTLPEDGNVMPKRVGATIHN
jgi:hypothetical protein